MNIYNYGKMKLFSCFQKGISWPTRYCISVHVVYEIHEAEEPHGNPFPRLVPRHPRRLVYFSPPPILVEWNQ